MRNRQLDTFDFVQVATALTNESYTGTVHLSICKGVSEMDPFIGSQAPMFFNSAFYGNLYAAQMYATKLFDTDHRAFTVPRFIEMACRRRKKFQNGSEAQVLACLAEAEATRSKLEPAIQTLRGRRNKHLAHISEELVFKASELRRSQRLTMNQIEEVLYEGGKIVNQFLILWNGSSHQLRDSHADDYKRVISLMSKQLCAEADAGPKPSSMVGKGVCLGHETANRL
jgi:AbiU2